MISRKVQRGLRKGISLMLCLMLLLSLVGQLASERAAAAVLSLSNPGFEHGLTGWTQVSGTSSQVSIDSTSALEGNNSLKIIDNSSSAGYMLVSDAVIAQSGNSYTGAAKFLQTGRTTGYAKLALVFYGENGVELPVNPVVETSATYENDKVQNLSVSAVAPSGTVAVSVKIGTTTSYISTAAWYDAISLTEEDASENPDETDPGEGANDLDTVTSDKAALQIGFTQGDTAEAVKHQITLATTGASGSTITWSSDTEDVIGSDGWVNRPSSFKGDRQVKLTAEIKYGSALATKSFELMVKSYSTELGNAGFETGDRSGWKQMTGNASQAEVVNTRSSEGSYSLRLNDNSTTAALGVESEPIEAGAGLVYKASSQVFLESGNGMLYIRFYDENQQMIEQASASATVKNKWMELQASALAPAETKYASVLLYSNSANAGVSYYDDIKLLSYRDTELLESDLNALQIGYANGDSDNSVTQNLILSTQGAYSTIVWTTSAEQYIGVDGTVTRPALEEGDKNVTLTATITVSGQTAEKEFEVVVKASGMTETRVELPLVNPGFEQGLTGWTMKVGTQSVVDAVSTRAFAGQKSLYIHDSSAAQAYTIEGQKELAAPDIIYTASAQLYQLERKASYAYFYLYFYDKGNNLLETKSAGGPYSNSTGNNWTPVSITAKAPAGTRYVSAGIGTTSTYTGKVWVDDIQIEAMLEADNIALTDGDAVEADAAALSIGFIGGDHAGKVTGNIELPVVGENRSIVMWNSDQEAIISRNGVVSRSQDEIEVVITATITRGRHSVERSFPMTVAKKSNSSVEVNPNLPNPEFNEGMEGWEQLTGAANQVSISPQGYAGLALELNNNGSGVAAVQSAAVQAEKKMEYTAAAKIKMLTGNAWLELRFYDVSGNLLMSDSAHIADDSELWQDIWFRSTAPAGAHHMRIVIGTNDTAAHFVMDNVQLSGGDFLQDNRGFEAGIDGWKLMAGGGSILLDSTTKFSGQSALKMQSGSGAVPEAEGEKVFVAPGEMVAAFAKTYIKEGAALIRLTFYTAAHQLIGTETARIDAPRQGWTNLGVKYTAPEGSNYATVTVLTDSNSLIWFDEVYVSKEFTYLGVPIHLESIQSSAYGKSTDGKDIAYSVMADASAENTHLVGVDLDSGETVLKVPLGTSQGAFSVIAASDGNIYIGSYTEGRVYKYMPGAMKLEDLGIAVSGQSTPFSMADGGNGVIYGGTYDKAYVFKYTPGEGFTTLSPYGAGERFDKEEDYVRGLAVDLDHNALYAGIGSHAKLVRYNLNTGQSQSLLEEELVDKTFVYHLKYTGGKLFATTTPSSSIMVLDIVENNDGNVSVTIDAVLPDSYVVSDEYDGKIYYITADQKLNYYHIASKTKGAVLDSDGQPIVAGITPMTLSIVQMSNQEDYPGYSLVGMGSVYRGKTGTFVYHLQSGKLRTGPADLPAAGYNARSIVLGSDGAIYTGNHLGGGTGFYYPLSGMLQMHPGLAQIENGVSLDGKIYFGTYTQANIMEYDPSLPWDIHLGGVNPKRIFELSSKYQQDRPFGMAAGDGWVFAGTVPDYGILGGAVAIYNTKTKEEPIVIRNIVQNQSIVALEYADGVLYGGSSVWGGLGVEPTESTAKFFAYNTVTNEKIFEREIAAGKRVITSLVVGQDGNIWGMAEGHLFIYDPQLDEIVFNENLFPEINYAAKTTAVTYGGQLIAGDDGYMYGNTTGKLFRINPNTMEVVILRTGGSIFMEKDHVGNIYFSDFTGIIRYSHLNSNARLTSGLDSEKLSIDIANVQINYAAGDDAEHVTANLGLATNGVNGSTIQWQSSHPEIIQHNGTVIRPDSAHGHATVELTAVVQHGELKKSKKILVTVSALSEDSGNGGNSGGTPPYTGNPSEPENKSDNIVLAINILDQDAILNVQQLRTALQSSLQKQEQASGQLETAMITITSPQASFELQLTKERLAAWLAQLQPYADKTEVLVTLKPLAEADSSAWQTALQKAGVEPLAEAFTADIILLDQYSKSLGQSLITNQDQLYRLLPIKRSMSSNHLAGIAFDPVTGQVSFAPALLMEKDGALTARLRLLQAEKVYTAAFSNKTFRDTAGHWAEQAIAALANKLLVYGVGDNRFAPEQTVKRAEFATILARALALPTASPQVEFTDVRSDKWYASEIAAAVQANLVQGYSDGSFRPDKAITREEIAVMMMRALAYMGMDQPVSAKEQTNILAAYKDVDQLSWSASFMAAAVQSKLIAGKPGARLDAKGELTRAEMAVILERYLVKIGFASE